MEAINELLKFYEQNEDFKSYIDKCVKCYGKTVDFMLHTPIAYEYYKQLRENKNDRIR